MSFTKLILRNLLYHWRGNFAVLLGVMVGSAVLTGALLVGDSLTGSLRDRAEQQLGWVDHVLVTPHLLHEDLADEVDAEHACPVLLLQGRGENPEREDSLLGQVTILGVTEDFWYQCPLPENNTFWKTSATDKVVLSRKLADDLHVQKADKILLQIPQISLIPRESSLGQRDADRARASLMLTVAAVLDNDHFGSRFSARPQSGAPRNAFLPLAALQQALQNAAAQDRTKIEFRGRINTVLAKGHSDRLQASLHAHLSMDDWGLVLRDPESRTRDLFASLAQTESRDMLRAQDYRGRIGTEILNRMGTDQQGNLTRQAVQAYYRRERAYVSLESRRMLVEDVVVEAAEAASNELNIKLAPTLVYLADSLSTYNFDRDPGEVPWITLVRLRSYVLVAAIDPNLSSPVEPLVPSAAAGLKDSEILLVDSKEPMLKGLKENATINMAYYDPEKEGALRSESFVFKALVQQQGAAADPDMTPQIPGVTDQKGLNWDVPRQLHYDAKRLRPEDHAFWDEYRTTPRAYITLARGQKLWKSRFGKVTSIRMVPTGERRLDEVSADFQGRLLLHLDPEKGGMAFEPVRANRVGGAAQSTDFSMLFLAFSIFIIAAALLLVGLLFRLNLDRRSSEIGLLLAMGYRRATIRNLLLVEGAALSALGGLLGLVLALGYARVLLLLLRSWWPGQLDQSFLRLHVTPATLVIGFVSMLVVSVLTVFWVIHSHSKIAASALLAGSTTVSDASQKRSRRLPVLFAGGAFVVAVVSLIAGFTVRGREAQAGAFFAAGMFLLVTILCTFWAALRRTRHAQVRGHGPAALGRLAVRNASRHPLRSLLTASLLASAAFVVVAVQSFRKEPDKDLADVHSGSGGFAMLAQTDLPVYHDLGSNLGHKELLDPYRQRLQNLGKEGPEREGKLEEARLALEASKIFSCRLKPGDDASCLNLSQPRRPRILGVPDAFIDANRLRFAETLATTAEEKDNPWLLLRREADRVVPVIADKTTVEWTLHSNLGATLEVPGPGDKPVTLQIVGLLEDSIFQSEVLMSAASFETAFPEEGGYRFFLIAAPKDEAAEVQRLLAGNGYEVTESRDRLQAYLEVENTYLATFQALGSLGLVLGTLGLGIVLLRSVWERRGELALLRALGYRTAELGWLILAENAWLLLLGLGAGTCAALLAVAPQLLAGTGSIPWLRLLAMLAAVIAAGTIAGMLAVASSLRADLIPALRRE